MSLYTPSDLEALDDAIFMSEADLLSGHKRKFRHNQKRTPEKLAKLRELAAKGEGKTAISEVLGVDIVTVREWARRYGIVIQRGKPRLTPEGQEARAAATERMWADPAKRKHMLDRLQRANKANSGIKRAHADPQFQADIAAAWDAHRERRRLGKA